MKHDVDSDSCEAAAGPPETVDHVDRHRGRGLEIWRVQVAAGQARFEIQPILFEIVDIV